MRCRASVVMCEDRAMLAARIHEDGGPEVVVVEDAPDPVAGPGEVLVRLRAASLNHLDIWVRKGLPSVPKPRILGADGAGIVEAVGDDVTGFAPGDRVVINPGLVHGDRVTVVGEHFDGTHAELIAIAAEQVFHLDENIPFETAAAFPLVFETAYRKLAAAREWGADLTLNHNTDDVVQAVKDATGGGVDTVVETVGEATWSRSL